jgi:integrase
VSVFKKYRGKRVGPRDKNYSKATFYIWKRVDGKIIHKAIPLAQTKEEAEHAEREIIRDAFNKKYGRSSGTSFEVFANGTYTRYFESVNTNLPAKRLYVRTLIEAFKGKAIDAITPQDCRDIQAKLRKKLSASSVNLIMSTASKIFTLACQESILNKNPMQYVPRLKEPPSRDRLLSKEEWERLCTALESDPLMAHLVSLAVNLPARRGQLLAITPDAVDFQNGLLRLTESKGRAARYVPLNSTVATTLTQMLEGGLLPFPLKETGIRKRFVKLLKRAKISGFRFHDFRHCTVTNLINNGVPAETVRKLYGHSDMKVTRVYINPEMDELQRAVRTLDNVVDEMENVQ